MEDLINQLNAFQIDEQTVFLVFILIATVVIIFTLFLLLLGSKSPIAQKLEEIRKSTGSEKLKKSRRLDNTLESLAPVMQPANSKESESIRSKLMHAGYHDASAITIFYAFKGISIIFGLAVAAFLYFFLPEVTQLNLLMIVSVAIGLYTPNIALNYMVDKRQSLIRGGVPDALDLLVVCTESGLGFGAALRRVADELMISHPDFADELDTVCAKIKAGVEMSDAFSELVERTGVKEIAGLVTMLSHASRIGGSLSQTLREYTEDFRDKRNQEVEEIAAKIPTKMIFPLLIFIWPCFFIVAIGPSMLSLTSTLGN
ncbi:type II secretion system F family protein [Vibrio tubiashii]|uniref:Pilus assembly protein TadC n=1 Tax=Vibrio tubiashii ATCC 19109 TaxID=1051646 RepID=F9TBJ9_9VIBR|nr:MULTISPECIES: type II secretion system F family protein [Vibrio oreintalis group]AIW13186.1 pilus assembly protein TadC [Vibrio tubiashii ATCC 19109]EGU48717.1 Flp pilus assembly protein TadC [Vibrio tubiashii ATCC 19109]EIF01746.1 Flp pilus assembly protein TadC [Vibrio tubiashii NCIMB 1337 = ATCC 19106]MCG9583432.1 type II secretion system F family protein [Vibrio tubiashii]MCG9617026.1 type II secretion system F family protein [Vibrio tubiashii]